MTEREPGARRGEGGFALPSLCYLDGDEPSTSLVVILEIPLPATGRTNSGQGSECCVCSEDCMFGRQSSLLRVDVISLRRQTCGLEEPGGYTCP